VGTQDVGRIDIPILHDSNLGYEVDLRLAREIDTGEYRMVDHWLLDAVIQSGFDLGLRTIHGVAFGERHRIFTTIGNVYSGTKEATAKELRLTSSRLGLTTFPLIVGVLVIMAWQFPFLNYLVARPNALVIFL
jgi:hypothetical protein